MIFMDFLKSRGHSRKKVSFSGDKSNYYYLSSTELGHELEKFDAWALNKSLNVSLSVLEVLVWRKYVEEAIKIIFNHELVAKLFSMKLHLLMTAFIRGEIVSKFFKWNRNFQWNNFGFENVSSEFFLFIIVFDILIVFTFFWT